VGMAFGVALMAPHIRAPRGRPLADLVVTAAAATRGRRAGWYESGSGTSFGGHSDHRRFHARRGVLCRTHHEGRRRCVLSGRSKPLQAQDKVDWSTTADYDVNSESRVGGRNRPQPARRALSIDSATSVPRGVPAGGHARPRAGAIVRWLVAPRPSPVRARLQPHGPAAPDARGACRADSARGRDPIARPQLQRRGAPSRDPAVRIAASVGALELVGCCGALLLAPGGAALRADRVGPDAAHQAGAGAPAAGARIADAARSRCARPPRPRRPRRRRRRGRRPPAGGGAARPTRRGVALCARRAA
jgi:hypothetical protein